MTPALTHAATYSTDETRATMSRSPLRRCHAKWNASAAPHTSAPDPRTVNVPPAADASPATPTAPTSCACHGAGSVDAAWTVTASNVAVASSAALWLDTASPTYTLAAIEYVSDPTSVQVDPSHE